MSDQTKSDPPPDTASEAAREATSEAAREAEAGEARAPAATAREARDELSLALGHLGRAARKLAAAADPAIRRAADEAEKALERASTEAEPIAKQVGDQLAGLTRSFVGAIDRVVGGVGTGPGTVARAPQPAGGEDEPRADAPERSDADSAAPSAESGEREPPDSHDQNT